ncbi:MAG: 50S ribosome-binding GTPase, partial [Planctomycetes bacterium]|nr:50S ribosome-binding GTPase [Planctomycetota bacterium]
MIHYPTDLEDTIAAIASAPGGAFRGVVRLSGPDVANCLNRCFQPAESNAIRTAAGPIVVEGRVHLDDAFGDAPCDVFLWPTNRSYTRQPSAEIHTIGSPPLLDRVLSVVCASGARLAAPGEFTMRAFLAGRLDLTQAEAVLGVIDAASRTELDVALSQLAGGLAEPLNRLRDGLLDLLAQLEAGLDFVEDDIEFIRPEDLLEQMNSARDEVTGIIEQIAQREESASEFRVVLLGWPNVGKSSLLNALAGEATAIVSSQEGTTRDYVARRVQWRDIGCLLIDTAGIAPKTADRIDAVAQGVLHQQAR